MNFGLSDEQEMVVESVRSFVEKEIYPLENDIDKSGIVPHEVGQEIKNKVKENGKRVMIKSQSKISYPELYPRKEHRP
mgnify:CR=1 FL=1